MAVEQASDDLRRLTDVALRLNQLDDFERRRVPRARRPMQSPPPGQARPTPASPRRRREFIPGLYLG